MVSNGDLVRLAYMDWTKDIREMTELSGRHAGWALRESENNVGPWLMGAIGAFLFFGGRIGWFSDKAAEVAPEA